MDGRSRLGHWALAFMLATGLSLPALAQDTDSQNKDSRSKNLDVRSSVGDLHVGDDGDAKKVGVPLYPGARPKTDDKNSSPANLSLLTDAFGIKLVVAKYVSNDPQAKVLDFYRDKLKRYGKVLECHSQKHGEGVDIHDDEKDSDDSGSKAGKPVKCDENSGPVTELKVGTEDNQRVIAVEPGDGSNGTTFTLVYVYTRGKKGDI